MARILIHTLGSSGDVNPSLALGLELRARGHDIHFALSPSSAARAQALGFAATVAGPDPDFNSELLRRLLAPSRDPVPAIRSMFREAFIPSIGPATEALEPLARDADLFLSHSIQLAAPAVAARTGVPWVSAVPAITCYPSGVAIPNTAWRNPPAVLGRLAWALGRRLIGDLDAEAAAEYAKLGVPPRQDIVVSGGYSRRLTVGLWSPSFFPRPADWPAWLQVGGYARWDGRTLLSGDSLTLPSPSEGRGLREETRGFSGSLLPSEERAGEEQAGEERAGEGEGLGLRGGPLVVFTLGSSVVNDPRGFYEAALAALAPTDWRAILLGAPKGFPLPEALRDRVRVIRYAPYADLFPLADAVVHQGGVGTTQAACWYGVPSLVVPRGFDQWENAAHIQRNGWGLRLRPQDFSPYALRFRLERLLGEAKIRAAVAALGDSMRAEAGPARTAALLEAALEP